MPELKYSEETFRDMYEALKAFDVYVSTNFPANIRLKQIAVERMEQALEKAESKLTINEAESKLTINEANKCLREGE